MHGGGTAARVPSKSNKRSHTKELCMWPAIPPTIQLGLPQALSLTHYSRLRRRRSRECNMLCQNPPRIFSTHSLAIHHGSGAGAMISSARVFSNKRLQEKPSNPILELRAIRFHCGKNTTFLWLMNYAAPFP